MWKKIKLFFQRHCSDCGAKVGFWYDDFGWGCDECIFTFLLYHDNPEYP